MTLRGICSRCQDERRERPRPGRPRVQTLYHGPEGEHLCHEHHDAAWDEIVPLDESYFDSRGEADGE